MSANLLDEQHLSPSDGSAEPLYLASGDRMLFGWLHWPTGPATDLGLVICKPFGYESVSAHRSIRTFAESAAGIGIPALRFDYAGTGDSQDLEPGANELEVWSHDVLAAVGELRRRTGVERVCLLGFRLGAALAVLAACRSTAVNGLIAVAPVIGGRRYMRELRTAKLAAAQGNEPVPPAAPGAPSEFSGFVLSSAAVAAIAQLDLMALRHPPAPDMLVVDRSDLPGARAWSEQLSGLGVRAQYSVLPGVVEMIMTAPHFSVTPPQMLVEICDWLKRLQTAAPAPSPVTTAAAKCRPAWRAEPGSAVLQLPTDPSTPDAVLTERPVFFSTAPMLFGVVTEPQSGEARRRGVILLNDGATAHIGSNRMYVTLARNWARRGYVVLRADLSGLGDSSARPGRPDNEVFPPQATEDIRLAVEFLRKNYGARDMTLGGLCSGAYHSLRAAVNGVHVNHILMVNPQNFFWEEGMTLTDIQLAEVAHNPSLYRERILSAQYWKRLLTGQVNVWRIFRIYVQRVGLMIETILRDVARRMDIRLPHDLGSELEELAARGTHMVFVFSRSDMGLNLLRIQAGSTVKRLSERCTVHIIDGADHIFSQSGPRQLLEGILADALFTRQRWQALAARTEQQATQ